MWPVELRLIVVPGAGTTTGASHPEAVELPEIPSYKTTGKASTTAPYALSPPSAKTALQTLERRNSDYNRDPGGEEERVYFTVSVSQDLYSQQALWAIEIERKVEVMVAVP
ncbi:hypothetical protein V500_07921 [Pseudogymnoascus sp. VKM F-4518 (FW-2643)]|nr:hypothetical protein V500_07921 [Pseudogymnoascus sp. VKM F-4518 (FW-2643)]